MPVGDYHFPNTVAWALAGEARADDDRMLELLSPYAGQRGRVLSGLVTTAGTMIRYSHTTSGVGLVLTIEPGEPADLEREVLLPAARAIGDGS